MDDRDERGDRATHDDAPAPGEGERMYRPDLMQQSTHDNAGIERRTEGEGGYWGQGAAEGEDLDPRGATGTPARVDREDLRR
jgi:hypothetical protein